MPVTRVRSCPLVLAVAVACKASAPAANDAGAPVPTVDAGVDGSVACPHTGLPSVPSPTTGVGAAMIAVADMNGDGKPDIVTVNSTDSSVSVLLGNGDGTFQDRFDYPTRAQPRHVDVVDVNGDGRLDVITISTMDFSDTTASVLLGNGNGTLGAHVDYVLGFEFTFAGVVDVNGDGHVDIVGTDIE